MRVKNEKGLGKNEVFFSLFLIVCVDCTRIRQTHNGGKGKGQVKGKGKGY